MMMFGKLFGSKGKDKAQDAPSTSSSPAEGRPNTTLTAEGGRDSADPQDGGAENSCRKTFHVEASAADVAQDYATVLGPYLQHGSVPGFRKGKAPRDMILRQYGSSIQQEFQQTAVTKAYRKAIKEQGLSVVAVVNVTNVIASPETGVVCDVTVDVAPEVTLPKYRGIPVKKQTVAISDEQFEKQLRYFQERFADFKDIAEGDLVAEGDTVQVDYTATLDGKPLAEAVPDAGPAASANGAWCMAGENGSMVPGMSEALVGAAPNATLNVTLTFPATHPNEKLQGQSVDYAITLKSARKRILAPLDEAFCKKLGVDSIDVFRAKVREQMEAEATAQEMSRRHNEAAGYLMKHTKLDLPKSLVQQETRTAVNDVIQSALRQGMTEDQLKAQQAEVLKTAEAMAQQRLRMSFILTRIADEEKIEATQNEIDQRLARMAQERGVDAVKMKAEIEAKYGFDALISDIRSRKAMELVLAESSDG